MIKRASDLREAINVLDPEEALTTSSQLRNFHVERDGTPIDKLQLLLEVNDNPQKLLFTGHRGSGTSTELARLEEQLDDDFRVVVTSALRRFDLFDLTYVDVLLGLALQLADIATEEDISIPEDKLEQVLRFTNEVTEERHREEREGDTVKAKLSGKVALLSAKLSNEAATRQVVREKVQNQITELLDVITLLVTVIHRIASRELVVIFDDLDKAELATAKRMFYEHGKSLAEPPLHIIYTFPIPLRHDNSFQQIKNNFPNVEVLPNIKTQGRDGSPHPPGIQTTKSIVTKRVESDLFDGDALDELARLSSGIPRQLITLARQACVEAVTNDESSVDQEAVHRAAHRERNEYEVLLDRSQRELLTKIQAEKEINNDEAHRQLLHNLSVLEYRNDTIWYDVHPLVVPLIEESPGDDE